MAKLVIVESPAKAKTIGKYLGDDYEVTASMGHIRDLPASQLGIDVEHGYAPQYISIKGKEKLIKELKSKAKHADGVLLARPYVTAVYGGGAEGIRAYVDKLRAELTDTMAMCGAHSLSEITPDKVRLPK